MKRKIYRYILVFAFFLLLFAGSDQATQPVNAAESRDFYIVDGKLLKYRGNDKNVVIPEGVTCIGENSEEHYSLSSVFGEEVETVSIPSSVTTIARYSFNGCINLKEIIIPESVTSIDDVAFAECTNLKSIVIPESVTSIGFAAFQDCSNLKDIEIKGYGVKIGFRAFDGTPWLEAQKKKVKNGMLIINDMLIDARSITSKSVTIPSYVRTIAGGAFYNCRKIVSVKIPDQLHYIGDYAFESCIALKEINLPSEISIIEYNTFFECESLEKITIPKKVKEIEDCAFSRCFKLKEITFLNTDILFGMDVFRATDWLYEQREISPMVIVGSTLIDGVKCSGDIVIPDHITRIGKEAFSESDITGVYIPSSVKVIDNSAFANCEDLTKVEIAEGVSIIETYAFSCCYSLKSIVLPDSVTELGARAFMHCDSLEEVKLPSKIKTIEHWTFGDCPSLKKIVIPDSVTYIDDVAFHECTGLKEVYMTDSVKGCSTSAFDDANRDITIYTVPNASYAIVIANRIGCKYQIIDQLSYLLSQNKISVYTTNKNKILRIVDNFGRYVTDDSIVWKSSNEAVAKVSGGKIIPVKKGKADIIASYQGKDYKCTVTVMEPSISSKKLTLYAGRTRMLFVYGYESSDITWKSSDKSIVTVNKLGAIQTKNRTGKATISATVNGVTYTCKLTVE